MLNMFEQPKISTCEVRHVKFRFSIAFVPMGVSVPRLEPARVQTRVNTERAAEILFGSDLRKCGPQTVRDMCRAGTLPALRIGTRWLIEVSDIEALVARGKKKGFISTRGPKKPRRTSKENQS